jgi:hypothetical protein
MLLYLPVLSVTGCSFDFVRDDKEVLKKVAYSSYITKEKSFTSKEHTDIIQSNKISCMKIDLESGRQMTSKKETTSSFSVVCTLRILVGEYVAVLNSINSHHIHSHTQCQ